MNKFWILIIAVVGLNYQLYAQKDAKSTKKKPNVIMIMADDLGWGDVGFNGNDVIKTPHLDKMASNGVTMPKFYAASPLCSPSRASCLTGRDPFRTGILAAHTAALRPAEKTVAEILKGDGYKTGFFGKWHLGWIEPDKVESRGYYSPPSFHGFEHYFATKSAVPTWDPTKTPERWKGFGAKKDGSWGGSRYFENGEMVTENLDGDDSRIIMDRAIPFIEEAAKNDEPFLATIWFHAPHEPVVAGPEYLKMYKNVDNIDKRHLYGCITAMDEQIGRLKKFLKKKGLDENTIILFTSDNGACGSQMKKGAASAGPYRGHKHQMWEGGLRVPFIAEWPSHFAKGTVVNEFRGSTNDLLPTILALTGTKMPKKPQVDGVSLVPVFEGEDMPRDKYIASGFRRLYKGIDLYALIGERFKICIPDKKEQTMVMYDLKNDPYETTDVSEKFPKEFEEMKEELEKVKNSWLMSRDGADYTY
ncbi:sulfatase-like hydrolase/transferase [Flammeovirga yaeyamensis]|uniref:Sulfatase-like hydrolase/transferase n=1 Tax=Flammeovirga yaeyamensis TaxID=367791 RepID=A0AAX1N2P5_9BACT|nr:sulfatase-like hydrolase/transferase [Flammeovirga yaeyamensis]MBB3700761.1 arylsulfatase A-like enzyme [Flammeovirga yaeyamensis]QWG01756.1 sulfatase-like hydrolase/transferase [Flammeovirga yaeyamensis]